MTKIRIYNDGIIGIYDSAILPSASGSKRNIRSVADLEEVCSLPFTEKSVRQQDVEFAEQTGKQLTYKIVTPLLDKPTTKMYGVIGDTLYSIINIDKDRKNQELYFYLEEVRKLEK